MIILDLILGLAFFTLGFIAGIKLTKHKCYEVRNIIGNRYFMREVK